MSLVAFLFLLLGFRHFRYCTEDRNRRQLQRLSAGVNFLVGLSTAAGVVAYSTHVYQRHQFEVSLNIPGFPGFEYGYSLWLAAAASLSAIATAVITACESCRQTSAVMETMSRNKAFPVQEQVLSTYV
ncbi:hypothetical protein AAFF_G00394680 [Aldrovandia affinis]|uniref:Uncharacterized protein n=1 Tax=Aldrovandia affinis TaxID=143900 RepID=A0AAD7SDY0_9TELE|nr:hypothetical protein AAFF_G00394680 [Aldrovandia affinis]